MNPDDAGAIGEGRPPIAPRRLYYWRPGIARKALVDAAARRERHQVEAHVRAALDLVGVELVPSRRATGYTRARCPRLMIGRSAFYLRRRPDASGQLG